MFFVNELQIDSATGESLTYIQLANKSIRCALWLKKENIAGGDVISICSLTSIPLYVSFFATLYVGGIVCVMSSATTFRLGSNLKKGWLPYRR